MTYGKAAVNTDPTDPWAQKGNMSYTVVVTVGGKHLPRLNLITLTYKKSEVSESDYTKIKGQLCHFWGNFHTI